MAISLIDDGTLDTVLRCDGCGEEFRFNYAGPQEDLSLDEAEKAYDSWIADCRELVAEHVCRHQHTRTAEGATEYCHDDRHNEPCPLPCVACEVECDASKRSARRWQVTFGCVVDVVAKDKYEAAARAWGMATTDAGMYLDGPDPIITLEVDENGDTVDA